MEEQKIIEATNVSPEEVPDNIEWVTLTDIDVNVIELPTISDIQMIGCITGPEDEVEPNRPSPAPIARDKDGMPLDM